MSGYNRSCRRADSSILLAAQCAAALSIMPTSAPSCWSQGVTAASYKEYAIWISPSGGDFVGKTIGEAWSACQQLEYRRVDYCTALTATRCIPLSCKTLDICIVYAAMPPLAQTVFYKHHRSLLGRILSSFCGANGRCLGTNRI